MVFVFAFLGEFGYELLNWQGLVRRFAATRGPSDLLVCCSRSHVYPLYEMADLYVDLSDVRLLMHTRACCYSATLGAGAPARLVNRVLDTALRGGLRRHLTRAIQTLRPGWGALDGRLVFVFSSRKTELRGVVFGCDPDRIEHEADIAEPQYLDANLYRRVAPDLGVRAAIEGRLGFGLDEPYVLVQSRTRRVGRQSRAVPTGDLIRALASRMRVVLLSFETGRAFDSYSRFQDARPGIMYAARAFPEQACLVHFARHCVFLTEGEFGSHTYVPPFMGKDVTLLSPRSVDDRWRQTIEVWNRHVCRFGGQIRPAIAEEVLASPRAVQAFAEALFRTAGASGAFSAGPRTA